MNLQNIAEDAREYCENEQNRELQLKGACHKNAIGTADYIRLHTPYNPLIVWGVIYQNQPEEKTADKVKEAYEPKNRELATM